MNEKENNPVTVCIDPRKNRIRIFKTTLLSMGNPSHVQLLVNPDRGYVAIRPIEKNLLKEQAHNVTFGMQAENTVEIYSRQFIEKLTLAFGRINSEKSFHLTGVVLPGEKTAVFSINTLSEIED